MIKHLRQSLPIGLFLLLYSSLFASVNNADRERFSVVHPKPGDVLHVTDSTFVFGNFSLPCDSVTVNGLPAYLFPNGTFLAMIPVAPGSLNIHTEFKFASGRFQEKRNVFIPTHLFSSPHKNILIEGSFIYPDRPLAVNPGERIAIIAKGTPNAHMYFSFGEGRIYRMREVNKKRRMRWKNTSFGLDRSWYLPSVDGIYVGYFIPKPEDAGNQFRTLLTLITDSEEVISIHNENEIYVRRGNTPIRKEIVKPKSLVDYKNKRFLLTYLYPGAIVTEDGGYGDYSRITLAEKETIWLPRDEITTSVRSISPIDRKTSRVDVKYSQNDNEHISVDIMATYPHPVQVAQSRNLRYYDVFFLQAEDIPPFVRETHSTPLLNRISGKMVAADKYRLRFKFDRRMVWGYELMHDGKNYALSFKKSPKRESLEEQPLKNMVICIDPGHGPDNGAFGLTGINERIMTVDYARKLKALLEKQGAHVVMTRTEDTGLELYQRTQFAEANNSDLFISLHFNALPNGVNPMKIRGTSTFYFHPHSKPLANMIHRHMLSQTKLPDKGVHAKNFSVCRITSMPSVLLEPAFIMQPYEEMRILNPEFRDAVCQGICDGIVDFVKAYD
ncbi:MAG: N-acetylmuramoyl-L-alanine amidase [Calditrichaeota bacterium]|nr:MAG: N-acetylmuramoyl-L-alanine amidase [Calditrichota bacterium]